jgi:hypothetical protein
MAVVPIAGTTIPLPVATVGSVQYDVIMLAPDGLNAMDTFLIDGGALPTDRERFYAALVQVARSVRALVVWKYGP